MDLNKSERNKTTFWVTLSLLGSSVEPIVVKLGQNNLIPSSQLLILKLLCGGLFCCPFYRRLKWHSLSVLKHFVIIALLAMFTNYCVFLSLENLSVPLVITLISTTPIFVGLIHQIQGRVVLKKEFWIGFVAVFVGIIISIDFNSSTTQTVTLLGIFYALLAIIGSTAYRTKVEKLCEKVESFQISIHLFFINGILAFWLLPVIGEVKPATWPVVLWLGLAGVVANIGFINAIRILGATKTSIISLLQRPLVILIASLIFNTPLTVLQMAGVFLVVFGVSYAKAEKKKLAFQNADIKKR